jgi:hypothetical protein
MELPDNNSGWRSEWFYIADQKPKLPKQTGFTAMKVNEWDLQLTTHETEDLKSLLTILADLKKAGLTGGAVAISFNQ